MPSPTPPRRPAARASAPPETVDPRWIVRALAASVAAAAVLAYLSVCLLVWQGAWQSLLHPSARVDRVPTVPFEAVDFDAAATGVPRLTGWWIPAGAPSAITVLFLHDGHGSLADTAEELSQLHAAGVNLFAFDPRGFGHSAGPHPTETRMQEDAATALAYLVETRHLDPHTIVPWGRGLGAALALHLATDHPALPGIALEDPAPDARAQVLADRRHSLLPVGLLVREHFDVREPIAHFTRPKLLLATDAHLASLFATAPDPRLTVALVPGPALAGDRATALRRFLELYLAGAHP